MAKLTRYPEVTVSGSPRELGRQLGEAAGETIRAFCAAALERVNQTVKISRASADAIAAASIDWAERYSLDMVEELRGTAEAARVTLNDLMLLQVRNQLQPDAAGGCTSFAWARGPGGGCLAGQNWDNDPALDPFTIVLTRRPTGKPAFTTVTQAGLIAYIGLNDAGIGVCLNSLPAPSRKLGVPHYFTVRGIYEARSLEAAVEAVRRAERAIPANIMLATPEGPANLEVTIDDVCVLTDPVRVTHANHCLHPRLAAINGLFGELIQSHARLERIDALFAASPNTEPTLADLQAALRDHQDWPHSICRHANDDPKFGFWETVFSVILDPVERCVHVTRGTPCTQPYETYRMV